MERAVHRLAVVSAATAPWLGSAAAVSPWPAPATPGSTHIRISTTGGFTDTASDSGAEDQRITLSNVDLRASLGLDAQASDHQIINELMQRGKLLVDQA